MRPLDSVRYQILVPWAMVNTMFKAKVGFQEKEASKQMHELGVASGLVRQGCNYCLVV